MRDWKLTLNIWGNSYKGMRISAIECLRRIEKSTSFTDLEFLNMGHTDSGGNEWGYNGTATSPVEARIVALREEADRLEADIRRPQ